jgi:hypothetical protein
MNKHYYDNTKEQMVSLRLEKNLFDEIKERIKVEDRTLSDLGRELFTTYLQFRNKLNKQNILNI